MRILKPTPAQERIIALLCQGHPPKAVARILNLSSETVHNQIKLARKRLCVASKEQLIVLRLTGERRWEKAS